jgi:hypothetical protein
MPSFKGFFRQKTSASLIFSGLLFLVCMSLDFYVTNVGSQGDFTQEANVIGRLWWQLAGSFRFIEIPIWALVVLSMAYVIHFKSKFFALVWLNFLALNHLLGFLTWLPYGTVNFLYAMTKADWQLGYAMSLISIPTSLVISFVQIKIRFK